MGNAGDPSLFVEDLGIAAAIDMDLDLVVSSRLQPRAEHRQVSTYVGGQPWKLDAAEQMTGIRTIDRLGPRGAYHESIEDLRSHSRVREFREFLAAVDEPSRDAARLTDEVNRIADKHARDVMENISKAMEPSARWAPPD